MSQIEWESSKRHCDNMWRSQQSTEENWEAKEKKKEPIQKEK